MDNDNPEPGKSRGYNPWHVWNHSTSWASLAQELEPSTHARDWFRSTEYPWGAVGQGLIFNHGGGTLSGYPRNHEKLDCQLFLFGKTISVRGANQEPVLVVLMVCYSPEEFLTTNKRAIGHGRPQLTMINPDASHGGVGRWAQPPWLDSERCVCFKTVALHVDPLSPLLGANRWQLQPEPGFHLSAKLWRRVQYRSLSENWGPRTAACQSCTFVRRISAFDSQYLGWSTFICFPTTMGCTPENNMRVSCT